jgi:Antitoxin VbhA
MDGRTATRNKITREEMERRREAVRTADAENRLEGLVRDGGTDPFFEAFIRGEIELPELLARVKAHVSQR